MPLGRAFGWSAIESIASRVFDLVALWVVLNALPEEEVAVFGVATAAIFFFNFMLISPETSLLRFQKLWQKSEELFEYVGAFVTFNFVKLCIHCIALAIVAGIVGVGGLFYAVLFSLTTQLIQAAEISRIYHRMELSQRFVAKFELATKLVWMISCLSVFYFKTVSWYFSIFTVWALGSAIAWLSILYMKVKFRLFSERAAELVFKSLKGFSLWSHLAGVITLFLYNSNVLFLKWFSMASTADIALMTVINKTANLFFVVPMFIQGFVPVMLANAKNENNGLIVILIGNASISVLQLLAFIAAGSWLGKVFGVNEARLPEYYELGLWVCIGIFVLNVTRPLSTYLMVKAEPWRVLSFVFIPVALVSTLAFAYAASEYQSMGVVMACCAVYSLLAVLLVANFLFYKRRI